ncbi:pyridoxamine 5'-phosphate oxidase [Bacteroidia bacterium]|nr:pyridoxamine 5'-phosphate oxidase [Bacteroidia bacterium]GHT05050.1 pyridoxamine 5'-phosphate oxidase [Bacteroidia bacterium]GHT48234.1 pyridoxamine 5'-phosphate oxidase [Bacteroidia bacterium]
MKQLVLTILVMANITISANAQTSNDMQEVHDFLKKCGTYFIATVEGDQPRVRPFGTVHIFDGKLYIQTGKVKKVAKQIAENPKIEICAYDGEGQWIRIQAIAVEDTRREAKQSMLDAYPSLKSMYSADDENTLVLYLTEVTATIASFSGEPKVVKF